MRNRYGLISALTTAFLFLLLETASVLMMVNNGAVQRFKVVGALWHVEAGIWGRTQQVRQYFNLKTESERLSAENLQLRQELARYTAAAAALDSHFVTVTPDYTFIRASIVRNSVNAQHNYIVLDQGAALLSACQRVLSAEGVAYGAQLWLGVSDFPDRTYGGVRFPAGAYDALEVVLGDGAGHNWWCVLFPPLCVVTAEGEGAQPAAPAQAAAPVRFESDILAFLRRRLGAR